MIRDHSPYKKRHQKAEWGLPEAGGEGREERKLFSSYSVSVLQDKNVLEMCYTTVHLHIIKMVNIVMCFFTKL